MNAKQTNNPDQELITQYIAIAAHLAAGNAALKADPDGNSVFSAKIYDRHWKAAKRLVAQVSAQKAKTPLGVLAQARLIPAVLNDNAGFALEDSTIEFIQSFVVSVENCLEPKETPRKAA